MFRIEYIRTMEASPLTNNLLELLGEPPHPGSPVNPTTLLAQARAAEQWLLTSYLGPWLTLIGGLVDCEYPLGGAFRVPLRAIGRLQEQLDPLSPVDEQVLLLVSIQSYLKSTLKMMGGSIEHRDMQWGLWARDVPMAIAYGFDETEFLDTLICCDIAQCCMYAAFLVSQVVTDDGVAEEIEGEMFGEKPRRLIELLTGL